MAIAILGPGGNGPWPFRDVHDPAVDDPDLSAQGFARQDKGGIGQNGFAGHEVLVGLAVGMVLASGDISPSHPV